MDVFAALADPTRRRIVELVSRRDLSAGEIAENFQTSRPAISKHLRVLRETGVLSSRGIAQQRIYSVKPQALDELDDWSRKTRSYWAHRLGRLNELLQEETT